jgi:capsular polysaccharide biosynthesis protein
MDERAAFRTVAQAVKRRYYLLVAIVAGLTLAAGVAAIVRPPVYQGTALLFVDQRFNSSQSFDVSLQAGGPLSDHFIQTANSRAVLERACSGRYFDTPATSGFKCDATTLTPRVSANTVATSDWIAVNVSAGSAAEAAALANAVAGAMVDLNQVDIDGLLAPTRDYLNSEMTRLQTEILAEHKAIAKLQGASGSQDAIAAHKATADLLASQYQATATRVQDLAIEETRLDQSLKLNTAAALPLNPIDPDPVRYLAVGLVAGLCIGLIAVLLVDRYDDRLFDSETLSVAAGTRVVLAVASRDSQSLSRQSSNPFAMAHTSLLALHPDLTKVLVVAASSRDRVRPVAAGLGMAAVKAGQRVLVVDPEAPNYVLQQQAGRNGSRMTIVSAPVDGEAPFMDASPADQDRSYDLTIIPTPPPDNHPAAVSLARIGDIAIVVATAGVTHFADVKKTTETLRLAGIEVTASILAVDKTKDVEVGQEGPEPAEPELYEMAVNQLRLPTWRGPGG